MSPNVNMLYHQCFNENLKSYKSTYHPLLFLFINVSKSFRYANVTTVPFRSTVAQLIGQSSMNLRIGEFTIIYMQLSNNNFPIGINNVVKNEKSFEEERL